MAHGDCVSKEAIAEDIASVFTCGVCFDVLVEPVALACGHLYCKACVQALYVAAASVAERKCPMCRAPISLPPLDLGVVHAIVATLDKYAAAAVSQARETHAQVQRDASHDKAWPVFWLPHGIAQPWPGEQLSLRLFEPRYRRLAQVALAGSQEFIVLPRRLETPIQAGHAPQQSPWVRDVPDLGPCVCGVVCTIAQHRGDMEVIWVHCTVSKRAVLPLSEAAGGIVVRDMEQPSGMCTVHGHTLDDMPLGEAALEPVAAAGDERVIHRRIDVLTSTLQHVFQQLASRVQPGVQQMLFERAGPPPSSPQALSMWLISALALPTELTAACLATQDTLYRLALQWHFLVASAAGQASLTLPAAEDLLTSDFTHAPSPPASEVLRDVAMRGWDFTLSNALANPSAMQALGMLLLIFAALYYTANA